MRGCLQSRVRVRRWQRECDSCCLYRGHVQHWWCSKLQPLPCRYLCFGGEGRDGHAMPVCVCTRACGVRVTVLTLACARMCVCVPQAPLAPPRGCPLLLARALAIWGGTGPLLASLHRRVLLSRGVLFRLVTILVAIACPGGIFPVACSCSCPCTLRCRWPLPMQVSVYRCGAGRYSTGGMSSDSCTLCPPGRWGGTSGLTLAGCSGPRRTVVCRPATRWRRP